ncbi:MAG TPA: hypothetical protein EYP56_09640, partial [Planctomycetaceae bacterium]|nr:hypothetical protein [Planctomycetaceae bacterium]
MWRVIGLIGLAAALPVAVATTPGCQPSEETQPGPGPAIEGAEAVPPEEMSEDPDAAPPLPTDQPAQAEEVEKAEQADQPEKAQPAAPAEQATQPEQPEPPPQEPQPAEQAEQDAAPMPPQATEQEQTAQT